MATAHLPSILPTHSFAPFDPLKTEKYLNEEHEYEISKWLKLENEPLPGLGGNSFISASDLTSSSLFSAPSQLPTLQPEFSTNYPSSFSFSATTANSGAPQSAQLPSSQTSHVPANPAPQYTSAPYSYPVYHHASQQYPAQYQTIQYTTSANQGQQYTTSQSQQYATAQQTQYSNVQYSSTSGGAYASQFAPATGQYTNQATQYTTQATQYTTAPYQYLQPGQYSTSAQQQYAQSIVPAQIFQPQYATVAPSNGNYQPTQFQYLVYQHQMMKTPQGDDLTEDKKRKQVRPFPRRVRQTRPKVVEAKGAVQCKGRNRKKGTQCRNAALMEYIGPRPIYCAEHIELDPKSLYEKCKSSYQKEPGDNKGCKEVVLKEFGVCYKHYPDLIQEMIENREYEKTRKHSERVSELLTQLEKDAAAAKKKDGDLYQRKNKLIPKFQEMKKLINRALEAIESYRHKDFSEVLPSELAHLSTPIVLDGLSVHIVETFTSSEDEDLLSSPHSDSSLEEEFEQILS